MGKKTLQRTGCKSAIHGPGLVSGLALGFLLPLITTSALAINTQVLLCRTVQIVGFAPPRLRPTDVPHIVLQWEIRSRWTRKAVNDENVTELWSYGELEMAEPSELILTLLDDSMATEPGTDHILRIVDGRNGVRDIIEDKASADGRVVVDGFSVVGFGFELVGSDGTMIADHLTPPDSIEVADLNSASCHIDWRNPDLSPGWQEGSFVASDINYTFEEGENTEAFQINNGLNDAWFNPDTAGQGFFITVFPDIELVFLAWFTYDTERPAEDTAILGESGHRWLTAQGTFAGNIAELDIIQTSGGVFDEGEPAVTNEKTGTMIVEFRSCTNGTIHYSIPAIDLLGTVPIQRIANDNVALCRSLIEQ